MTTKTETFKAFMARAALATGVPFESIPIAAPGELPEGEIIAFRESLGCVAFTGDASREVGEYDAAHQCACGEVCRCWYVSPAYGRRECYRRFFW